MPIQSRLIPHQAIIADDHCSMLSPRLWVLVNREIQNYFTFFVFPDYRH